MNITYITAVLDQKFFCVAYTQLVKEADDCLIGMFLKIPAKSRRGFCSCCFFSLPVFALSAGPITWILINEIFPNDVRVKGVTICTMALWIAVWVVGQFFPWLLETAGPAVVFWIFAGFSVLNLLFCLKLLVETKGKTLEQIEDIYVPGH